MCTLQNHVEKVCTLVSLNHVYFRFVYSIMAPPFWGLSIDFTANKSGAKIQKKKLIDFDNLTKKFVKLCLHSS